jgi:hypothetical protein
VSDYLAKAKSIDARDRPREVAALALIDIAESLRYLRPPEPLPPVEVPQ